MARISRIAAAIAAALVIFISTPVVPTTYAQNDSELTTPIDGFNRSMIFDWCRDPKGGSGVDRWCSGNEYVVTKNTVTVQAEKGFPLDFHMKFWHLGILNVNTYVLTYKITDEDGTTGEGSIDPAYFDDGYLKAIHRLELTLKRI